MRAMVLEELDEELRLRDFLTPAPREGQVLVRITACAVCRTDLVTQ
jgi:propanol-preferring alcohol dehydrogenase